MVTMLGPLYPQAKIVADKRAGKILVTAPLDDQRRIEAVIQQLDVVADQSNAEMAKSYQISAMPATTMVTLLKPSFPDMRLTASGTRGKQIAAFGSGRDHKRLEEMLKQLDNAKRTGVSKFMTLALLHHRALAWYRCNWFRAL